MMLLNAKNTRPATANDLKVGDLYIRANDPRLTAEGSVRGYRVDRTSLPSRSGNIYISDSGANRRILRQDAPVLIWTGCEEADTKAIFGDLLDY